MDLVDRSDLLNKYGNRHCPHVPLAVLEKAPAIDAVQVVRYKDCKYWRLPENKQVNGRCGKYIKYCSIKCKPDDFCSHGERMVK